MDEEEDKIAISGGLYELMKMSTAWIIRKIEAEEPFSAIMLSNHPEGRKGTLYQLDSVEEAFAKSEEDLTTHLFDAEAYAIAYDAWFTGGGKQTPVILCRVEESGMKLQRLFALPYELKSKRTGKAVNAASGFQYLGETERRILT